jgi:hypothetical protein
MVKKEPKMRRTQRKVHHRRNRRHHQRRHQLSFIEVMRLYSGMPVL